MLAMFISVSLRRDLATRLGGATWRREAPATALARPGGAWPCGRSICIDLTGPSASREAEEPAENRRHAIRAGDVCRRGRRQIPRPEERTARERRMDQAAEAGDAGDRQDRGRGREPTVDDGGEARAPQDRAQDEAIRQHRQRREREGGIAGEIGSRPADRAEKRSDLE